MGWIDAIDYPDTWIMTYIHFRMHVNLNLVILVTADVQARWGVAIFTRIEEDDADNFLLHPA